MLRRIKIQGYKSLIDIDVTLEQLTVLLGSNAAGKSNFLDALQLLSRLATSRTLKEAFDPPYRGKPLESFTFGGQGIRSLLEQESLTFQIEADVELSDAVIAEVNRLVAEMKRTPGDINFHSEATSVIKERFLRYRIEVEILPKTGFLRVRDEMLCALTREGHVKVSRNPFLENKDERLSLRMEGQAHPTYYELLLDYTLLSRPHYPPHYPHLVAMREELSRWNFFYFEPRERMRAPNPVKEVRHIGLMGEELAAFLNTLRFVDEKQFKAVEKALHMLIPSITGIDVSVNNIGEVELQLREYDRLIPARVVSEGTLRLLGLLALQGAKQPASLLGFEEPENGIHPRRIQMIAELLKTQADNGAQLIVTTHSPILPNLIPNESLFVCKRGKDGKTTIQGFVDTYGSLWRSQDIDQAFVSPEEEEEQGLAVSDLILRGDFDD